MARILKKTYLILASYELSCVLFILMLALTYLGTMAQTQVGLYTAQKTYFESIFLIHNVFGLLPVPLPGGYLVMAALFLNVLLGGILRAHKGMATLGVLTCHVGILVLLVGAFISFEYSVSGNLMLYEHDRGNTFQSYHDWEIGVRENTGGAALVEYVIAPEKFQGMGPKEQRSFTFANLPFELTLAGFAPNADVVPASRGGGQLKVVDGFCLQPLPKELEQERQQAGAYATLREKSGGTVQEGILWGGSRGPLLVSFGGKTYVVELRRRSWVLPFTIVLDKFTREFHPRTNTPKEFRSDVTKIEGAVSQPARITMNEPLRAAGYTLYQSSWGPANAGPNDRLYSVLAVVRNPAEAFPLYACLIVTAGMTLHFLQKLGRYLKSQPGAKV